MNIFKDEQILDQSYRVAVLRDIESNENKLRKKESFKRFEVYKDYTKKYVIERLEQELDAETVEEMKTRTSNISILKKIIDKKARVYKDSSIRESSNEIYKSQIDELVSLMNINQALKKTNKFLELFKNVAIHVLPYQDPIDEKYKLTLRILNPSQYDVIEDSVNPEVARAFIFSYYVDDLAAKEYTGERANGVTMRNFREGDGKNQIIADSYADQGKKREFVWWTNKFHFTTDEKGNIIKEKSPEDLLNPIQVMPFVSLAKDQDGAYWAVGGDDLVDGSILVNQLLTDLYFIAKVQGMGIFYMFGKGVPKTAKVGPNQGITVDVEEGDPTPSIGFATSNPPLDSIMRMIEQYVALMLSTNNLEPNSVSGQLTATNASSGIQEMIRKSEVTSAIEDEQEKFRDAEPILFDIISKWHNLYVDKGLAHDSHASLGKIENQDGMSIRFLPAQEYMSEKDKLEILEKRKSMGLDTMIDMIQRDNPDLTVEEAEQKLLKIMEEKMLNMAKFMIKEPQPQQDDEQDGDERIGSVEEIED